MKDKVKVPFIYGIEGVMNNQVDRVKDQCFTGLGYLEVSCDKVKDIKKSCIKRRRISETILGYNGIPCS